MTGQALRVQRVTLPDAVSQGLVERIRGLSAPDPTARRDFLEEVRATCPDEDAWNEEYLCRPAGGQAALLGYDLIAACEVANLKLWGVGSGDVGGEEFGAPDSPPPTPLLPTSSPSLYAGFDVGRKHDRSALWVLERVGDVFWTRAVRVLDGATFTAQEDLLDRLLRGRAVGGGPPAIRRLCIDATGIGAMLAERLRERWGGRVEPVHFTAPVKAELALPLLRLFQEKRIRLPASADVRADLNKVRRTVTAAGHARFDADRDSAGHADRFWALALAHHAADADPARLPRPVARKPAGW